MAKISRLLYRAECLIPRTNPQKVAIALSKVRQIASSNKPDAEKLYLYRAILDRLTDADCACRPKAEKIDPLFGKAWEQWERDNL